MMPFDLTTSNLENMGWKVTKLMFDVLDSDWKGAKNLAEVDYFHKWNFEICTKLVTFTKLNKNMLLKD